MNNETREILIVIELAIIIGILFGVLLQGAEVLYMSREAMAMNRELMAMF